MTLNFTGAGGPTMADLDEEFLKANGNGKGKRKSKTRSGEIIPVVRALLKKTVANGCTEAEARSAAAKAKELIDENNITDEEIHEDEAGDDNQQQQHQRHRKQADVLLDIALRASLFHAPDGTCFADIMVNWHRETWPVRSKGFRRWLTGQYYQQEKSAPNSEALQSTLNVVEARAHFDSPERAIHVRVANLDSKTYLDLGNATWQAVQIDLDGWRIVDSPPVRFRRSSGMQPLPTPAKGGRVDVLREFLNIVNDTDFVLVVAWLLAALRARGPYPVLVLAGEQGSAKSTLSSILRSLLDPNTAPLRALPREDRDLFIAANNGHVLAFDNVSGLPVWISDTLCRLATGGGFSVRQLYTDQDEILFDAQRPIILNGIEDVVARPDLADRSIFITLEPIPEERRKAEADLMADVREAAPAILGGLLDAVVYGLNEYDAVRLARLPRMADFAIWGAACEGAIWKNGTFIKAYTTNMDTAVTTIIESDLVADAIRDFMETRTQWEGKSSDLLGALNSAVGERISRRSTASSTSAARASANRSTESLILRT